ncbi:MAG: hypothetical protein JJT99_08190 [Rhodobacteraceae bacterium]|nr:hypothetical protein [Paracoccaceae bacterium]
MGLTFVTTAARGRPDHKAALNALVRRAVQEGIAQAQGNAKPPVKPAAFDWTANLPREDDTPAAHPSKPAPSRHAQAGGFDWAASLPSEKDH